MRTGTVCPLTMGTPCLLYTSDVYKRQELDITVNGRRYKLVHAMPKELFYLAKRPQLGEKYFSEICIRDRRS